MSKSQTTREKALAALRAEGEAELRLRKAQGAEVAAAVARAVLRAKTKREVTA